jgi:MFS family permease
MFSRQFRGCWLPMLWGRWSQALSSDGWQVLPSLIPILMTDRLKTHRSVLLVGLISLLGGTILFCFGRKLYVLIIARVLQGISSALVWIVGSAFIPCC